MEQKTSMSTRRIHLYAVINVDRTSLKEQMYFSQRPYTKTPKHGVTSQHQLTAETHKYGLAHGRNSNHTFVCRTDFHKCTEDEPNSGHIRNIITQVRRSVSSTWLDHLRGQLVKFIFCVHQVTGWNPSRDAWFTMQVVWDVFGSWLDLRSSCSEQRYTVDCPEYKWRNQSIMRLI